MQFKLEFEDMEKSFVNCPEYKNIIDNFNSEAKAVFDKVLKEHQCCLPCFIDKVKEELKPTIKLNFQRLHLLNTLKKSEQLQKDQENLERIFNR